jgi:hypothetical protein
LEEIAILFDGENANVAGPAINMAQKEKDANEV